MRSPLPGLKPIASTETPPLRMSRRRVRRPSCAGRSWSRSFAPFRRRPRPSRRFSCRPTPVRRSGSTECNRGWPPHSDRDGGDSTRRGTLRGSLDVLMSTPFSCQAVGIYSASAGRERFLSRGIPIDLACARRLDAVPRTPDSSSVSGNQQFMMAYVFQGGCGDHLWPRPGHRNWFFQLGRAGA